MAKGTAATEVTQEQKFTSLFSKLKKKNNQQTKPTLLCCLEVINKVCGLASLFMLLQKIITMVFKLKCILQSSLKSIRL